MYGPKRITSLFFLPCKILKYVHSEYKFTYVYFNPGIKLSDEIHCTAIPSEVFYLLMIENLFSSLLLRICPIEDENATAKFSGTFGCYEDEVAFLLTSSNQMGLHVVGVA